MSDEQRRICFISDAPHFGGAERYIIDMCAAAVRQSFIPHIHWINPNGGEKEIPNPFQKAIDNDVVFTEQSGYAINHTTQILRLLEPYCAIINASPRSNMWAVPWIGRAYRFPCAWVHHMVDTVDPRRLAKRSRKRPGGLNCWRIPQAIRHRLGGNGATVVVASNVVDAEYLQRWRMSSPKFTRVISPGVDMRQMQFDARAGQALRKHLLGDAADTTFVVGTATRLIDGKGLKPLINAIELMAKQKPPISLWIAGTGPLQAAIKKLLAEMRLEQHVRLLGFVGQMTGFYAALDAFALCSRTESFGLAITEAMACERAVVATPTHGARRQIHHGINGLLAGDFSGASIALCLRELRDDAAKRARMGVKAKTAVLDEFTIDRTLSETIAAMEELAKRRSRRTISMPELAQLEARV